MNSNNRITANTVFPRDIVCLRNISINTLNKGDDDDDDDDNNNSQFFHSFFYTMGYHFLCIALQNSWDIRTITTTVYYSSVLRTNHAYDRSCTNGIACFCQHIILNVPSVTRAYPPRRRRCKKTIKVAVRVLELVLEHCSLREGEEGREEIWGLPARLERDATYSVN